MVDLPKVRQPFAGNFDFGDGTTMEITVQDPFTGFEKVFVVHKLLICNTSKFMSKQTTTPIKLTRQPETFNSYVNWLYFGVLPIAGQSIAYYNVDSDTEDVEYCYLLHMYFLGTSLEDQSFCDAVLSAFLEKLAESKAQNRPSFPGVRCIYFAWKYGSQDINKPNSLQRLIVDTFAREETKEQIKSMAGKLPSNFLTQLACREQDFRLQREKSMGTRRACEFHAHGPDESCTVEERPAKRKRSE